MLQTTPRHIEYGLSNQDVLDMYWYMVLARLVDERYWLLNRAGKISFVVSCQGHEGVQAGIGFALDRSRDFIVPYYRDLCLALIFGQSAQSEMLAAFGRPADPNSGGRQMPAHYGSRKNRILSGSSPTGTQIPHAVGLALAAKMKRENYVTYVSFGEGSSNQGDFHEGLNFAGVHQLPVVFVCQNNKYAISVHASKQLACESVADRAAGYGFEGISVDGFDALESYRVMKHAVDKARAGGGPTLIEAMTYRYTPHSSDDDDRSYREKSEVEAAKQRDPILQMRHYLMEHGLLTEASEAELRARAADEVNAATVFAEKSPDAVASQLLSHVYAEGGVGRGY